MGLLRDIRDAGFTAEDWRKLKAMLNASGQNIVGPGITSVGGKASFTPPTEPPTPSRSCWVMITGNHTGGGVYTGKMYRPNTTHCDTSDNVGDDSHFGTLPGANNCIVFNAAERGQSTHDLTEGTPNVVSFPGVVLRQHGELYEVGINGYDWQDCASDDPAEGLAFFGN